MKDVAAQSSVLRSGLHLIIALGCLAASPWAACAETGKLTVRVVDRETGLPIAARLVLRAADGSYPGDRLDCSASRWPNIEAHGIFIRGEQTFDLPVGATSVVAARGLAYRTDAGTIELTAGKTSSIELKLNRLVDLRQMGWVAGDLHVHMVHGENQRPTSYEDVALTCEANGLDFVSVGQEYIGAGTLDLAGYHAACEKVSSNSFRMLLGAERPKNLLGHQVMLGVHNPFVINENPPYFKSARKVHDQGGVLVYVHPVRYYPGKQYQANWLDFPGNNLARELLFDAYLGPSFDGLSVLSDEARDENAWQLWFQLLNRGCRVPIFADSDACFDRTVLGMKAPGFWNTYFYVGAKGAVKAPVLASAVRQGQTFATTGPLLQFRIDNQISGAVLPPDGKPHKVEIEAWYAQHAFNLETTDSRSQQPVGISKVELIRNGQVVHTWQPHSPHANLTHTVTETEPCWYVARVFGTDERWQVGAASPIYFSPQPAASKRQPLTTLVRGRIYDFQSGDERSGIVEIHRDDQLLKSFEAQGQFRVKMPLDAEIVVRADGVRAQHRNLLLDYGPVHKFLWYLEAKDLARPETFEMFEHLVQSVDLEFPLGHKLSGSCVAQELAQATPLSAVKIVSGPDKSSTGTAAIAAVLLDTEQITSGDTLHLAAVYRDEGDISRLGALVIEARGYDSKRPTAYGALKKFAEFEKRWDQAVDLGDGYRLVCGSLAVPNWVEPGPTGGIDLSVRARQGNGDAAWIGLKLPIGPTKRGLSITNAWPTMPVSWPDGQYGVGQFRVCNRVGRLAQSKADYRQLRLSVEVAGTMVDLFPARDALGCPDADDAVYLDQFHDQSLSDQSHLAERTPIRSQPAVKWREDLSTLDATSP